MFDRKAYMKEYNKQWKLDHPEYMKEYYQINQEEMERKHRQWRKDNIDKARKYRSQWQKDNPEKARKAKEQYYENNHEEVIERTKQWIKDNRKRVRLNFRQWQIKKRKTDFKFSLNEKIRRAIAISLKENKQGRRWEDLLGYTLEDLIKRLEITMPVGHNWQNFIDGKLHIDHIIPIRAFEFKSPEDKEFKDCWSLHNLRLLPEKENRLKHDTIDNPILLGLLINVK